MGENITKHDGFVMQFVARRIDERQPPLLRDRPKLVQERGVARQFGAIATTELFPLARIVAESAAQFSAWRDLLHPSVDGDLRFAHATRPEAVHQDADTSSGDGGK